MSLKGDKYETAEEARFRLEQSVVLYDGQPVYISRVSEPEGEDEIARVYIRDLPWDNNVKETRKYLSAKKFDLSPFKMGYVNVRGEAVYLSRLPARQNRQGLTQATCTITDVNGNRSQNVSFNSLLKSSAFVDLVNGKYPDFKEAGGMIGDGELASVALSRNFAFRVDNDLDSLILLHKGAKCGLAFKGDKAIKVPKKFFFLKEELEECRIPLA